MFIFRSFIHKTSILFLRLSIERCIRSSNITVHSSSVSLKTDFLRNYVGVWTKRKPSFLVPVKIAVRIRQSRLSFRKRFFSCPTTLRLHFLLLLSLFARPSIVLTRRKILSARKSSRISRRTTMFVREDIGILKIPTDGGR